MQKQGKGWETGSGLPAGELPVPAQTLPARGSSAENWLPAGVKPALLRPGFRSFAFLVTNFGSSYPEYCYMICHAH